MVEIGTPFTARGKKALLLGSGELGKEVTIELQRYGVEVVALDKYAGAPAMHVANRAIVVSMLDGDALRRIVEEEKPDYIIPEIEAIATPTLVALEKEGWNVVPTARATFITMNRREIRNLAAVELGLPTSPFEFADTEQEYLDAVSRIGLPCVVKPVMSSSGHGQSLVREESEIQQAWREAQEGGRAGQGAVIVEGFVDFDYEITLLTVRHIGGTSYCEPIGHYQKNGDYQRSWQPQPMSEVALTKAREVARKITDALGGYGIFGVELFIKGDDVIFSEVSPRPHDTGMVTLISQHLSEFALHVRALLGLPIPEIRFYGPAASRALLAEGNGKSIVFSGMEKALATPGTDMRIFGKPEVIGHRRVGVMLAEGRDVEDACAKAEAAAAEIKIEVSDVAE
ncbi:MAG: formate-dependent phosphoribosylglycinamide formyltransferase [Muribaculaceae bacterium]|nr:formate-dependent phosphoribosylglycinamide formyltransferase [Muribaculaceae bacterium]